ncbi:hypothetical protein NDU88_002859 [Pleurodeles waltl]|uniref:Uncharacterized protein n=1 Tax=Pleurodeles waltl TaxID=8319 RepID=A0AAV7MU00_PLEWA|nr:hypothetical protein NDU88_002859 [Pleurodeles waltl]
MVLQPVGAEIRLFCGTATATRRTWSARFHRAASWDGVAVRPLRRRCEDRTPLKRDMQQEASPKEWKRDIARIWQSATNPQRRDPRKEGTPRADYYRAGTAKVLMK